MKTVTERFLKYISFNTKSDEESQSFPSTDTQLDFGKILVKELEEIGLKNIKQDKYGYVTAEIPATAEGFYTVGFIAHMDTSPDAPSAWPARSFRRRCRACTSTRRSTPTCGGV